MNARSIVLSLAILACASATSAAEPYDPIADATRSMEQGVDAAARGDHESALSSYRHAALLVPHANLPHRYAGESLAALGRRAEAIASYERYLAIKPDVSDRAEIESRIAALGEPWAELDGPMTTATFFAIRFE